MKSIDSKAMELLCARKLKEAKDHNDDLGHQGAMSGFVDVESMEALVEAIVAGGYKYIPGHWVAEYKLLKQELERNKDPEYAEYLRLKAKFKE